MTIIEHMKNVFAQCGDLPRGFVRNPDFDMVLLYDTFERVPQVIRARNGHLYVYFDTMDATQMGVVRKMGFRPRLHKSRKYVPAKYIYRAPIFRNMPTSVLNVVDRLLKFSGDGAYMESSINTCRVNSEYAKYVASYKSKAQQHTK